MYILGRSYLNLTSTNCYQSITLLKNGPVYLLTSTTSLSHIHLMSPVKANTVKRVALQPAVSQSYSSYKEPNISLIGRHHI